MPTSVALLNSHNAFALLRVGSAQVLTTTLSFCVLVRQSYVQHHTCMYLTARKPYGFYIVDIYSPHTSDPPSNVVRPLDMTHIFDDPLVYIPFHTTNRGSNTPLLNISNQHHGHQIAS